MQKRYYIAIALLSVLLSFGSTVFAARTDGAWSETLGTYLQTAWPEGRDILINGLSKYLNFGFDSGSTGYGFRDNSGTMQVKNSGGAWTAIGTGSGGGSGTISTSSPLTAGQLVQSTAWNTIANIATSSLGLLTTDVAEGTNKYWTDNRFDARLTATTTLPALTTLANLATVGTITSGVWHGTAIADAYVASASTWNAKLSALTGNSLTKGYFLVGDDSGLSQATSTIFISSKGYVGVGTTTPDQLLQLSSAQAFLHITSTTGTNRAGGYFTNTGGNVAFGAESSVGGGWFSGTSPYAAVFGTNGAYPTQFVTNNAVAMTILSGGNIGVGTTTPGTYRLALASTASTVLSLNSSGASTAVDLFNNNVKFASFGTGNQVASGGSNADFGFGTAGTAGNIVFATGAGFTEKMRIASGGNVGIGTTSPGAKLAISDNNFMPMTITGTNATGVGYGLLPNGGYPGWNIWASNPNYTYGNTLVFSQMTDASHSTDLMVLKNNGNVGIGTTTPDSALDVKGSVRFEGASSVVTASIGGGALLAGACATTNTTITSLGAYASTTAFETTPATDPGDGYFWNTIAINATTVKTRVCASVAGTPVASTYNVKIIK